MHSISHERNWLSWLVKVRILILLVLLAIELAVIRLTPNPLPIMPFITGMVLWFVLSLFFVFLVSVWPEHQLQAILQVLADLAMVTLVVHVTGGIDSSLNFLYPLVIVVACMLLPPVWGYLSAALAFIMFGSVLELDYYLVIPSYATSHPKLKALQVVIFVNLFAYFAIAYLAGLLMSKLRQVDVQLKDASGALENLQALHENIVQSMSGGVITTGLDGRITLMITSNREACHGKKSRLSLETLSLWCKMSHILARSVWRHSASLSLRIPCRHKNRCLLRSSQCSTALGAGMSSRKMNLKCI